MSSLKEQRDKIFQEKLQELGDMRLSMISP